MEREILFRGKSLKTGKWLYGDLIHNRDGVYIAPIGKLYFNGKNEADFEVDPDSVGEDTGVKDCDGCMIFEGDIVRLTRGVSDTRIVIYKEGLFMLQRYSKYSAGNDCIPLWIYDGKCRIIGNTTVGINEKWL